jgi:ectoine hydroxylase-related dioxygenase (phytanoyl-CoA dioxygenase family)
MISALAKLPFLNRWRPAGTPAEAPGLWLDDAGLFRDKTRALRDDDVLLKVARDLRDDGFTILQNIQDKKLCDAAREDYRSYLAQNADYARSNSDSEGRQFRLTNFHLYSDALMRLGKNGDIMRVLDFIFGTRAAVYTSLTFQYSTEQTLHRDSPYFHTFPVGRFVGVWTALEDIHPDAGPLSYVPGSHRLAIDHRRIYRAAQEEQPAEARATALRRYNAEVERAAAALGDRRYVTMAKGDVAIWHPQLVHGGSPQKNPSLTRQSVVFHCCPEATYVYQDDVFFASDAQTAPPPRYQYARSHGRSHGGFAAPNFMEGR